MTYKNTDAVAWHKMIWSPSYLLPEASQQGTWMTALDGEGLAMATGKQVSVRVADYSSDDRCVHGNPPSIDGANGRVHASIARSGLLFAE